MSQEQLVCGTSWGYLRPFRVLTMVCTLSTLRHSDTKLGSMGQNGPLIPCERRLAKTEFQENQEVTFGARFENRDYARPFGDILVTLRRFD